MDIFNSFYDAIMDTISALGVLSPFIASILIVLESIIPILPLFVFITINFIAFGDFGGFIISWICTVMGCMLSFMVVKKYLRTTIVKKIKNVELLTKCMRYLENLSLSKITIILSIPFTPAFMMNIAAGVVNMDTKKYLTSLLISKIFLVYFWGKIGTGLIESIKNPEIIVRVIIMIGISYLISLIVKKVFKID